MKNSFKTYIFSALLSIWHHVAAEINTAKQCFKLNSTRTTQYSTSVVVSNIEHHQSLTSKHTSRVSKEYLRISTGHNIECEKLAILSDEETNALFLKMDFKRK